MYLYIISIFIKKKFHFVFDKQNQLYTQKIYLKDALF